MSIAASPDLLERPKESPTKTRPVPAGNTLGPSPWKGRLADAGLITLFLSLTFLLGVFPLKDADFYWHLRTGDLIRQTGQIPHTDIFTFERLGTPWIDLHWIFQIGISWLFQHGGVTALLLAKCGLTCLAVFLLITAPASVAGMGHDVGLAAGASGAGRTHVCSTRNAYFTLSCDISRGRDPLGPTSCACVLVALGAGCVGQFSRAIRPWPGRPHICASGRCTAARSCFWHDRRKWWRAIGVGSLATAAACLVNPYGLTGALYPLQLARTMANPIFSRSIAELMPVPEFIRRAGWWNLPLDLHLATIALGAMSFLVPLGWLVSVRLLGSDHTLANAGDEGEARSLSQKSGREERGRGRELRGESVLERQRRRPRRTSRAKNGGSAHFASCSTSVFVC